MLIPEDLFAVLAFYWCQGTSAVNPSDVLFQGRLGALHLQAEIAPQCLSNLHLHKLVTRLIFGIFLAKKTSPHKALCDFTKSLVYVAIPTASTFPLPLKIEDKTFHFLPRVALSCRNSGLWAAAPLSADQRTDSQPSAQISTGPSTLPIFTLSLLHNLSLFLSSFSFHMEWFGRGVGSGAPLFPGRLETKSGPGAAASAASEPKAEACTGTLSQAESLPSHPFSDAQGAEAPHGQGQRLGSYILCLEICVNHNISPKCEKCGKPRCRAGGNK